VAEGGRRVDAFAIEPPGADEDDLVVVDAAVDARDGAWVAGDG
jgi:hypothetical protein